MLCFSMICVSAGSKSNLVKAAGAEVAVELGNEKLRAAVARSIFKSKCTKHSMLGPLFEVAVARSTFSSQNVQNTACSDHFLKLRCGKISRRCSKKHIFKSKC